MTTPTTLVMEGNPLQVTLHSVRSATNPTNCGNLGSLDACASTLSPTTVIPAHFDTPITLQEP